MGFFAFKTGEDFANSAAGEMQGTVRQQLKVRDREEKLAPELKGSWHPEHDRDLALEEMASSCPVEMQHRTDGTDAVQGGLRFGGGKLRGF